MQMADWLINGLTATISGVMTVFLVLILIAFFISQLKYINKIGPRNGRGPIERNTIESMSSAVEPDKTTEMDDEELIAVISAAVAASMNTTIDQLQVKSIRRVKSDRTRR